MAQPSPPPDGSWPWQELSPDDGAGDIDLDAAAAALRADAPFATADGPSSSASGSAETAGPPAALRRGAQGAAGPAQAAATASAEAMVARLPLPPPPTAGRACIPCRVIHVRCDRRVPCSRCFRLCLQCAQPNKRPYARRRPAGGGAADDEPDKPDDDSEEQERSSEDRGSAALARRRQRGRKRVRDERNLPVDATPLRELIIARNDPGAQAALYMRSFTRLAQEGRLIRDRVLAMMRVWRVWSVAAGADVTWGLLGEMTRLLDVNPAELEEREALRWDMPTKRRVERAQEALAQVERLSEALRDMALFREADDGTTPLSFAVLGSPSAAASDEGQECAAAYCLQTGNRALAALLDTTADAAKTTVQYKAIQILNWAGFLDPSDREQFLSFQQRLMFTADTNVVSGICKASYGDGNVRLFLYRARRVVLEEAEAAGGRVVLMYHVEPCPSSKHVTDMPEALVRRPSHFHRPYLSTADASSKTGPAAAPAFPQDLLLTQQHQYEHRPQRFGVAPGPSAAGATEVGAAAAAAAAGAAPAPAMQLSLLATALVPPGAAAGVGGRDISGLAVEGIFRRAFSVSISEREVSSASSMTDESSAVTPVPAPVAMAHSHEQQQHQHQQHQQHQQQKQQYHHHFHQQQHHQHHQQHHQPDIVSQPPLPLPPPPPPRRAPTPQPSPERLTVTPPLPSDPSMSLAGLGSFGASGVVLDDDGEEDQPRRLPLNPTISLAGLGVGGFGAVGGVPLDGEGDGANGPPRPRSTVPVLDEGVLDSIFHDWPGE